MTKGLRKILTLVMALAAMLAPSALQAQEAESYRFDIGAGLGFGSYLGDANESSLFKHMGFSGNIEARYLFNERWALKGQFTYSNISGNTADFENKFPFDSQYEFKSNVYDLSVRGEVNFFNYGIGETYRRLRRWTPYLSLGIGLAVASTDGKANAGFEIPMGVGFRFKVRQRVNLSAEFTMTKVFSDKLDGYADPYQIKSSFLKNTDWLSSFMIGISYEFGPRCTVCNRLD